MEKLRIACIGCGSRGRTYLTLASQMSDLYEITAGAEPVEARLSYVKEISGNPGFQSFTDDEAILKAPKLADMMIVATQDAMHVKSCLAAMEKGYDILVEKPIATNIEDVLRIEQKAVELGRRVMVCHVLRYTPFYSQVKEIVDSGRLGEIISVHMSEGVGAFHQAHSFVRGHWGVKETSTPMLIAKSCHDLDILCWLLEEKCKTVSSFGTLKYFNESNAPEGAPVRCTDKCPVAETCEYNAAKYTDSQKRWLRHVWPMFDIDNPPGTHEIHTWLETSQWGRCVYHCDNNVVDHQVVNMQFENDITASFTMTAFDYGRNIEIFGTEACLRGGEYTKRQSGSDIVITDQFTLESECVKVVEPEGGYAGHGGGDFGLVKELYEEMMKEDPADMKTSIHVSVQSHLIGYAAEESRLTGQNVNLKEYAARI